MATTMYLTVLILGKILQDSPIYGFACPTSWDELDNSICVKIFTTPKTRTDASNICRDLESDLLSGSLYRLHLTNDLSVLLGSSGVSEVFLGLDDPWGTHTFQWADGSLFTDDTVWAEGNPIASGGHCVVFRAQEKDLINVQCMSVKAFICQKPTGFTGCYEAWAFGAYLTQVSPLISEDLTLQVCIQVCRGQGHNVASVWRHGCYCFNHLQMGQATRADAGKCDAVCPGNHMQICGNVYGQYLTIIETGLYDDTLASCLDLYKLGVRVPGLYVLQPVGDATPSVQDCYYTELISNIGTRMTYAPSDWIYWKDGFYKFGIVVPEDNTNDLNRACFHEGGGYLTSVLTQDELNFIEVTVKGSPHLSRVGQWRTGFTSDTGSLRWSDPVLFDKHPGLDQSCSSSCCIQLRSEVMVDAVLEECSGSEAVMGYICKQAHDFKGCRVTPIAPPPDGAIMMTSDVMSALWCKELCRAQNIIYIYVVLSDTTCHCNQEIPEDAHLVDPLLCNTMCLGHSGQMCAGSGFLLWYKVDTAEVGEVAEDCAQIVYNSLPTPETYLIKDLSNPGYTHIVCVESEISSEGKSLQLGDSTQTLTSVSIASVSGLHTDQASELTELQDSGASFYNTTETYSTYNHIATDLSLMSNPEVTSAPDVKESQKDTLFKFDDLEYVPITSMSSVSSTASVDPNMAEVTATSVFSRGLSSSSGSDDFSSDSMFTRSGLKLEVSSENIIIASVIENLHGSEPSSVVTEEHPPSEESQELLPSGGAAKQDLTPSVDGLSLHQDKAIKEGWQSASTDMNTHYAPTASVAGAAASGGGGGGSGSGDGDVRVRSTSSTIPTLHIVPESSLSVDISDVLKVTATVEVQERSLSEVLSSSAVEVAVETNSQTYVCRKGKPSENEVPRCTCLFRLTNAQVSTCRNVPTTSVVLTCKTGWLFQSGMQNFTIICGEDARWSPSPQHCIPGQYEDFRPLQ